MKDISIMISNNNNIQTHVSPIKYSDKPVVMIEMLTNAVNIGMPIASLYYQADG